LETSRNEYRRLKKELEMVLEGKLDDKLGEICKKIDEYVYFGLNTDIFSITFLFPERMLVKSKNRLFM
jgi:hypothetical protein